MVTYAMNKVDLYRGWCKKCGICIAFCPRQVLAYGDDSYPALIDSEKCTSCGLCATRCPDFAIVVHGTKVKSEKAKNSDNSDSSDSSTGK